MTQYVALLRGIGPGNPNMRNEKLRAVCEDLGLERVATVISSGNVVFETDRDDPSVLETTMEAAWPRELGFESTTIIRSRHDLEALVELAPFGDLEHGPASYLLVSFAKSPLKAALEIPHQLPDRDYRVVALTEREAFTVTDTTSERTPDVMSWFEGRFGRQVTSRTWLTVGRILKKMR